MAQEFHASLSVTLPEEPGGMATTAAALLTSWAELVEKLGQGNPGMKSQFGINETRSKSAGEPATIGAKRGRRPRQPAANGSPAEELSLSPGQPA